MVIVKYRLHRKLLACALLTGISRASLFAAQLDAGLNGQQDLIDDVSELAQARSALYTLSDTFISSLEHAADLEEQRVQALSRGEQTVIPSNPDLIARLTEVVIVLKDSRSIPALISVLGNGSTATPVALAEFGELAIPGLLTVISPPEGPSHQVHAAPLALRCMVEGNKDQGISPTSIAEIKDALSKRLEMKQEFVTNLWRDIELAIALDDPELRRVVELIASDQEAVIDRGVNAPDLIQKTQVQAQDRLNNVAAMPICEDFRTRINNRFTQ